MGNLCGSSSLIFAEESSACIGSKRDFRSTEEKVRNASGVLTDQWEGARAAGIGFLSGYHKKFADSLENLNRFTLVGKSALQYLTLVCDVGSLLFTLYVFALCIRSKDMKPKWLWLIIVLVGVGKFAVDWGTGQWTYQLIAIQIPCFSMTRTLYGPWTVAAYVPLGAMIFLHRRWKMKITGESIPPPAPAPE